METRQKRSLALNAALYELVDDDKVLESGLTRSAAYHRRWKYVCCHCGEPLWRSHDDPPHPFTLLPSSIPKVRKMVSA